MNVKETETQFLFSSGQGVPGGRCVNIPGGEQVGPDDCHGGLNCGHVRPHREIRW